MACCWRRWAPGCGSAAATAPAARTTCARGGGGAASSHRATPGHRRGATPTPAPVAAPPSHAPHSPGEPDGGLPHPHPITPEHQRIQLENQYIQALNDAMDLRDGAKLRQLAARYRAQHFEDVDKLGEGYDIVAELPRAPGRRRRAPPRRRSSTANAARSCAATSAATVWNSARRFTSTDEFSGAGTSYFRRMENEELAAALTGDEATFTALTARHQGELRAHCYRMLGSFNDAEDMVQETLLRAWRGRETFQGRSTLRAWLYGIATNACLDFLDKHLHRVLDASAESPADVPWLQPYPDRLLDEPEAAATAKQTIGLAFLVAVQFLPVKQRAVLILSDVLDWSAKETAALLDLSVAVGQQRAAARARDAAQASTAAAAGADAGRRYPDEQQRTLLQRYVTATERGDAAGLAALLQEDVRFSMPPEPCVQVGRDTVVDGWVKGGFGADWFGAFRCLMTRANGMPAVACYVRKPGATHFRAWPWTCSRSDDGLITEITTFALESMVALFDLPAELASE